MLFFMFCCFLAIWQEIQRVISDFIMARPENTSTWPTTDNIHKIEKNKLKHCPKPKLNNVPAHNLFFVLEIPSGIKLI
jgi:hypothetical protein